MRPELEKAIKNLPVLQKAHIYEPTIDDVAEVAFKGGIKAVMQLLVKNDVICRKEDATKHYCSTCHSFYEKLKEWRI